LQIKVQGSKMQAARQTIRQSDIVPTVATILGEVDYILLEWGRNLFPDQVSQLEIINNRNETFDVKEHTFVESSGDELIVDQELFGISRRDTLSIVQDITTDEAIEYVQAEFLNGRPAMMADVV